jgi:branched-chain amino acid transport system substrate-binding protein
MKLKTLFGVPVRSGRKAATARSALVALGATLACAAMAQDSPSDGVYKDRIDWGMLMDMSGPAAESQTTYVKGFQDFMRMTNEAGGINGRKINVLAEDNRFSAATDKIVYEKFVAQTPVLGFSGMGSSGGQVALAPTIRSGKLPVLGTYTPTKALLEPASPLTYHGMCSYKAMAQASVGYFADMLKLKAPKVVTVAIESAGGKEYHDYVAEAVGKLGGTATPVTMKINAVDITPQVLEIMNQKPDFITIYGVNNTAILTMKGLAQYGVKIPAVAITYLAQPQIYAAMGPQAGANYYVSTCVSPGGSDNSPGNRELTAFADKMGRGALKEDINYAAGWMTGQLVVNRISALGSNVTRARLVESMAPGFTVDTKGLTAPITYTKDDHNGPKVHKMITFDYAAGKVKHIGEFRDYEKYVK